MDNTQQLTPTTATTPSQLLQLAVDKDLDIEKLKELMALKKQWDEGEAKKAFFAALNQFQFDCPDIRKTREADFGQGKAKYKFAPLADIVRQIKAVAKACGLSYRWEIKDESDNIHVTCIVSHLDGHSEMTSMSAKADNSGSKNAIQAKGSAIEYMKRYTLVGALGLSTTDSDIDGVLPQFDMDILHKQYMTLYNELIQIDKTKVKWHPDEWKSERTEKVYLRAISEIRKELARLKPSEV